MSASGMPTSCATRMTAMRLQHVAAVAALVAAGAVAARSGRAIHRNGQCRNRDAAAARDLADRQFLQHARYPLDLNLS